jgi:hypothetical protein
MRRAGFTYDEAGDALGIGHVAALKLAKRAGGPRSVDPRRAMAALWPRRDEPEVREILRDFIVARSRLVVGADALTPDEAELILDGVELAAAS